MTINFLKNAVFLWGLLTSVVSGSIYYFSMHEVFITMHPLSVAILSLMLVSSLLMYFTFSMRVREVELRVDKGVRSLQVSQLKSDVDRYFKDHKDDASLAVDEVQYLYMLEERRQEYSVNSFTQRKIKMLLSKDIS